MHLRDVWAVVVGATEGIHDEAHLIFTLLVLFVAAKLGAEVFERLRQPAVVGEILGGILVGPQVLHLVQPNEVTRALAEFGVLFLLFLVGLETHPSDLLRVGRQSIFVAVGGVVLPMFLGYTATRLWGHGSAPSLFMGAALVATSVGITAGVLDKMGVLQTVPSRIILAAAVADDILGLLTLAVVSGIAGSGAVNYRQLVLTLLYACAFTVFMIFYGGRVILRAQPAFARLRIGYSLYIVSIAICLMLYVLAGYLGIAGIIGAFLAGVALSDMARETDLRDRFEALTEFFVPFFLASIGMYLNLHSLLSPQTLAMAAVITCLAILGKVVGCGVPLWRQDRHMALQVGVGMVPRGEVGILVAQLGLGLGVLDDHLFAVAICMAVVTTLVAPPLLAHLFTREVQRVYETYPDLE